MSYLTLPNGIPNFSKAVISLWFRVPKKSVAAAFEKPFGTHHFFRDLIPLMMFGKTQNGLGQGAVLGNICTGGAIIYDTVGFSPGAEPPYIIDPCFICLNCRRTDSPRLVFNIQMGTIGNGTNIFTAASSAVSYPVFDKDGNPLMSVAEADGWRGLMNTPGSGVVGISQVEPFFPGGRFYFIQYNGISDLSRKYMAEYPDSFYVETLKEIAPDQWHHLLLSFDVSTPIKVLAPPTDLSHPGYATYWSNGAMGVSSHARLWYAIDDVDYRGRATPEEFAKWVGSDPRIGFLHRLGPYSVDYGQYTEVIPGVANPSTPTMTVPAMGDPNGILTDRGWSVATTGSDLEHNLFVASDAYDFQNLIPSKDGELGLPGPVKYADNVYHVEMAEFAMFTGVTLDTGIESNRRAFVDRDGVPVPPTARKGELLPPAEKLLGKRPEILLHGTGRWINGQNTGSLGIDIAGKKIPSGQFTPTGKIDPYKPDPSLHGPPPSKAAPVRLTKKPAANARL